jgi:lactoylglutathione lyase
VANDPVPNVEQAVPFFRVADMQQSLSFYMDGLGFTMKLEWIDEGKLRWCWLELGNAALMLQEFKNEGHNSWKPEGKAGIGVTICFICKDALTIYRQAVKAGLNVRRPFVGNAMWVTSLTDHDGYRLDFESPTDAPEESIYSD